MRLGSIVAVSLISIPILMNRRRKRQRMPTVVTSWGDAILTALTNALNLLLTAIPRFLGFLVILLVGWILASVVSRALTFLLRKVGFDRLATRIGLTQLEQRMGLRMD